jgi:hypothetical protein
MTSSGGNVIGSCSSSGSTIWEDCNESSNFLRNEEFLYRRTSTALSGRTVFQGVVLLILLLLLLSPSTSSSSSFVLQIDIVVLRTNQLQAFFNS